MRAILIDRKGFRIETDLSKKSPIYEIDFGRVVGSQEVITLDSSTFYFERSFLDEFYRETFIYKER